MKPNKETEFNDFIKWSEELCNKRREALIESRYEKAKNKKWLKGNCLNPIKAWFYLGKKIKYTVYDVIHTNSAIPEQCDFKTRYEAEEFIKKYNGEHKLEIKERIVNGYAIDDYGNTPYDKLRWKAIHRWQKKIEKHGLEIRRPYFYYGKEKYFIWNSHLEHGGVYRKFCNYWWKDQFERIIDIPKYHYKTCWYDYFDLFTSLIVKLTIKGLYLGLYGNSVTHKEQMHEIWEVRRELIKAYNFEDYYEWKCGIDVLKDNPGEDWHKERAKKEKECMNKAFALLSKYIRNMWD